MKQLLLPAIALAVLAGPVAAAPAAHAATTKAPAAKVRPVRMSRSETLCFKNARAKYKAGDMRNRAEAKCRTEAHAMRHEAKPAKRKA